MSHVLLFVLVFSVLFSIVTTSLGEEGLFVDLFVYFAYVNLCPFSLPLGIRDWLRLVIVTLRGCYS